MRVPDAWFSGGLGQKIPDLRVGPGPDPRPQQQVGRSAQRLGDEIAGGALDQIYQQGKELEHLARVKRDSAARMALFSHENTLNEVATSIAADKTLPLDERRAKFREQADLVRGELVKNIPDEYRQAFEPALAEHRFKAQTGLDKLLTIELQDDIRASGSASRDELVKSNRPLSEKLALIKDPDAWDWAGEGYSDTERGVIVDRLAEEVTEAALDSRLNSEDPRAVLADLRATTGEDGPYSHYADLAPKTRQAYIRAARSAIKAQDAEADRQKDHAAKERERLAKEAYQQYKDMREGLYPIDPGDEADFWKSVAGTQYEAQARELRQQTGGLDYVAGKIKSDPLKYGGAQLGLEVPPLSTDNPAGWPAQIAARRQIADVIRSRQGLSYTPLLTNGEADALSGLFKTQAPQAQIAVLQTIGSATDPATMRRIAGQFASTDRELGAVTALVADGKQQAAYHVANGRRLLEEKAVQVSKYLKDEIRGEFDDQLENALAGMPAARETLLRSVELAYLSLNGTKNVAEDDLDGDLFEQALALVGGETAEVNGKKIMLPSGMSETQFVDRFEKIDAQQVQDAGGIHGFKSAATAAEDLVDDAEVYETGTGRFRFVIDGQFLARADDPSRFFELDLSGVKE